MQKLHPETRPPAQRGPIHKNVSPDMPPSITLITGATGFIGGACTVEAIESGRTSNLLFLVRAKTPEEGLTRVIESLRRFELSQARIEELSVQQIILGDLADVEAFADDVRLNRVTHVMNCAAIASFGNHPGIWPILLKNSTNYRTAPWR